MSKYRGHYIELFQGEWVYSDTKESVKVSYLARNCGICDKPYTNEGHDACLRNPEVCNERLLWTRKYKRGICSIFGWVLRAGEECSGIDRGYKAVYNKSEMILSFPDCI
ncbi:hypothetical protein LCGC14_0874440 [marine sediment metagenome]|uniref:Uncharacterized protein n=1 Tax=marine sediment metagenome TaxID=412755 RepID=A0A0F9PPE5_9ZZZZ